MYYIYTSRWIHIYIYVEWINIMIEGDKINKIKGKKVWNDEKLWDSRGGGWFWVGLLVGGCWRDAY